MRPRRLNRLAAQITLLILISIVLFQSIMIVLFHVLDVEGRRHIVDQRDFIAGVVLALDVAPVAEREALLAELSRAAPYVNVSILNERPPRVERAQESEDPDNEVLQTIALLWKDADAFEAPDTQNSIDDALAVRLRKGGYALVSIAQHQKPPRSVWRWLWEDEPGEPFILTPWARAAFAFFLFTAIFVYWTSNAIMAPLKTLARHAERFPDDVGDSDELALRGPQEVRELTRSINRMQTRIRTMIAERAHVLAAVSHDLRTIITRLKLKADLISSDDLQRRMLRDIDLMDGMLHKNLQYLRAEKDERSDRSLIDLDSVLQTVANEFSDLGHDVKYLGGRHEMVFGSLNDLQRIFTNLVENAIHFGEHVEIRIHEPSPDSIQIEVLDDGPGISAEGKASAFKPFVRGQPGRTLAKRGGFGLGLSIAQTLAKNHNGMVSLHDRDPHGLIARVTLPRAFEGNLGGD